MKESIIKNKSFEFALQIIRLYKVLQEHKEFVLSKQILRAGTSIGANIEESIGSQSSKDFLSKISIAYKESRETIYWLKLLTATHFLTENESNPALKDAEAICRILGKIQIAIKNKINTP